MHSTQLLDCAGRRRSPATMSGFHRGRLPRNALSTDPPTVEEIIAVMRAARDRCEGLRLRGVIVVLWRAGLRVSEPLALQESDLDRTRGAVLVRRGKGGKRREVGMDRWAWEPLEPWLAIRAGCRSACCSACSEVPPAAAPCSPSGIRVQLRTLLDRAGRRRSPATTSTFHQGASPGNKGLRYPPDPPTVEEIIAVMRAAGDGPEGVRLRVVIVVLWCAGLRVREALALNEADLDVGRGALLVRHGEGDKRREVGWTVGHGHTSNHGLRCARVCRSDCCSASSADRHGAGRARRRASAGSCMTSRLRLAFVDGSRHISCDTRTRLRCHARGSRYW